MNKTPTKSLIDIVVDSVLTHMNRILLVYQLSLLDAIERNYALGLYKSKCNYYIDRNEVKFQLKQLKNDLKGNDHDEVQF